MASLADAQLTIKAKSSNDANSSAIGEKSVGIIGLGVMGRMYADRLSSAGWKVNACDREDKFLEAKKDYADRKNVTIFPNGHLVSRISDYIIYSVEAEHIDAVVAEFAQSTKHGAIVGGQTSCKEPEIRAFEKHLRWADDISIISVHSMHGPTVDPQGQPLIFIPHRVQQSWHLEFVKSIFTTFQSRVVELPYHKHDMITADTQAVTHAAFLSMGMAWRNNDQFPWESDRYIGGLENIKINVMMRIYSSKWHVYAGLSILNPAAKRQIKQYAQSVTELFKLMLVGDKHAFGQRIKAARDFVFPHGKDDQDLLLEDSVLDEFSLRRVYENKAEKRRNSHLSLLAMVDCWYQLRIQPYDHMICSTPLFRLLLGATEYLYRNESLLDEAIDTAIEDRTYRSDDLEFTFAARGWSDCVSFGDFPAYKARFERIQEYFTTRFKEANDLGNQMIKTILAHTK